MNRLSLLCNGGAVLLGAAIAAPCAVYLERGRTDSLDQARYDSLAQSLQSEIKNLFSMESERLGSDLKLQQDTVQEPLALEPQDEKVPREVILREQPNASESVKDFLMRVEGKLAHCELTLASLEETVKSHTWVEPPPPIEVFRSNPKPRDWVALSELYLVYRNDRNAAGDMARFRTYDEILSLYGPPTSIAPRDGIWNYRRNPQDNGQPKASDSFLVNGYVTDVDTTD